MKRVDRDITIVDHALSLFMILSATFVAGAAIGSPAISYYFMGLALLTTFVGYLTSKVAIKYRWTRIVGYVYAVVALFPWIFASQFNRALPDHGFPFALIMTGILSWMLVLTQTVTWKDTALCFQVVPCIAIFGLVGAYDYYWTPFLFFGFLIGATSLFFRAHARQMLRIAEQSLAPVRAYGEDEDVAEDISTQQLWRQAFDSGAWRWMAGAEWALVSALVIVLCSILGAPVIKFTTHGITEAIRVSIPNLPNRNQSSSRVEMNPVDDLKLGQGPVRQTGAVMARVRGDVGRYWRTQSYVKRTLTGWSMDWKGGFINGGPDPRSELYEETLKELVPNGHKLPFDAQLIAQGAEVPVPGEVVDLSIPKFSVLPDGTVRQQNFSGTGIYQGTIWAVANMPDRAQTTHPPEYLEGVFDSPVFLTSRVVNWSKMVAAGATDDLDKARKIQHAIEARCKYNLQAKGVPMNAEPVDSFLFETQEGYCDLFASAMATAARVNGLPARVMRGYLNRQNTPDKDGWYTITDKEAHLWCEIYFKNVGWVVFDPTDGAVDITPDEEKTSDSTTSWLRPVGIGIGALFGAALLVFGARTFRWSKKGALTPGTELVRIYGRVLRHVERKTGKPKRLSETPIEYLTRVRTQIADWDGIYALHTDLEQSLYGPGTLSATDVSAFQERVKQWRRDFKTINETPDR